MPWKGQPPSATLPRQQEVDDAVSRELETARADVLRALEDGTPVDTGRLRASWEDERAGSRLQFAPTAPYAPYVQIDYAPADREAQQLGRRIGERINKLIGG